MRFLFLLFVILSLLFLFPVILSLPKAGVRISEILTSFAFGSLLRMTEGGTVTLRQDEVLP